MNAPVSFNDSRTQAVNAMFGNIVDKYDLLNHALSFGIDYYWRSKLVHSVRSYLHPQNSNDKHVILDIAAGTLDVSIALLKHSSDAKIISLDYCKAMLSHGIKKLSKVQNRNCIIPINADARKLPLPDESVDAITIAFGIRNIEPRPVAFKEMFRVLKKGGRLSILEFGSGKSKIWFGLYNFYLNYLLPVIGKIISKNPKAYRYLAQTINTFPKSDELADEIRGCGFSSVSYISLTGGISMLHIADK